MTKTRDLSDFLIEGGADLPLGKPHIVPGVLYPAVSGKLLDGTTTHGTGTYNGVSVSTNYGTTQSDGRKYYYTEIKGSKPIKDPRIGGHFGSQRYKFKSLQLLEQETATSGVEVHSIDGREWMRTSGKLGGNTDPVYYRNDSNGVVVQFYRNGTGFIELTGYFNDANFIHHTGNGRGFQYHLDGGSASATLGETTVNTPLTGRYVDGGSVTNLGISTTLGIHTLKIRCSTTDDLLTYGIELIAQDTSNRNNIQIPSQNVVSFGKKFSVSGTPHYDPFTTMSYGGSGTTLSALQSLIDTDTSLGMDAWKAGGSNYHRPWNGGRVIKWVDSSGVIKTSVNMMPPNAQNISTTASNPVSNTEVEAGTNGETINFNTSAIDHSQAEVAKTFHFREFGNGSANGTITGSYPDTSMLDTGTNRDIAYVMDDGLTSFYGDDVRTDSTRGTIRTDGINDTYYITFIGTGFTFTNQSGGTTFGSGDDFDFIVDGVVVKSWQSGSSINEKTTVVQNLPYGTHVFQMLNTAAPAVEHMHAKEFTFHQPKRPPIPEDACVLADYMLMADFVPQTSRETDKISKGIRRVNSSRDVFYDGTTTSFSQASTFGVTEQFGFDSAIQNGTPTFQLPYFGTGNVVHFRGNSSDRASEITYSINGNAVTDANFSGISRLSASSSGITFDADGTYGQNVGSQVHNFAGVKGGISLGSNIIKNSTTESSKYLGIDGIDIATPIHTSSHYQPFETPYLHELVGGDRNMEQNNLVVSPDGKTWDKITRDTSYLGPSTQLVVASGGGPSGDNWNDSSGLTTHRGFFSRFALGHKNIAWGYDRVIILEEGLYDVTLLVTATGGNNDIRIQRNATGNSSNSTGTQYYSMASGYSGNPTVRWYFERNDYIFISEGQASGAVFGNNEETGAKLIITKVD